MTRKVMSLVLLFAALQSTPPKGTQNALPPPPVPVGRVVNVVTTAVMLATALGPKAMFVSSLAWDSAANPDNPDSNLVYIVQGRPSLSPAVSFHTIAVITNLSCNVVSTNSQGYYRCIASNAVTGITSPF